MTNLPVEVYARVVPFLKREEVLAFYQVVSTEVQGLLAKTARNRLETVFRSWEESYALQEKGDGSDNDKAKLKCHQVGPVLRRAVACIRQVQEQLQNQETEKRRLEGSLIMSDLFSLPTNTSGVVEWPIWCGRIQVLLWAPRGIHHGMQRIMIEANVQLLSPNCDAVHYPSWNALGGDKKSVQLVAESYNFVPTTPMGRLVGLTQSDKEKLQTLAGHLANQNTVAVPPPGSLGRQRMLQALRVVSRSQAKQRLKNMPSRLPFRFYVDDDKDGGNDMDLICCWELRDLFQDSTDHATARALMPNWQTILQTREKGQD